MTDVEKFWSAVERSGMKKTAIASKLGISYQGFLNKVNNTTEFRASEIAEISGILRLAPEERDAIFFAAAVDS